MEKTEKETERHAEKLEDAIIDGLFTVSTVRYDNEKWPQGDLDCLGWATVSGRGLDKQHRRRKGGREREKLELLPSSWS